MLYLRSFYQIQLNLRIHYILDTLGNYYQPQSIPDMLTKRNKCFFSLYFKTRSVLLLQVVHFNLT